MLILQENSKGTISKAVDILRSGGIIAFPTETIYALSCDASNYLAIEKIYKLKRRDKNKAISVFVRNIDYIKKVINLTVKEELLIKQFMPGPLTLISNKKKNSNLVSQNINNNSEKLGFRIPNHKFSLDLIKEFDGIIAATSVNLSKKFAAVTKKEVMDYFDNEIDLIVDGDIKGNKIASTVLEIVNDRIQILREGLISKQILNFFNENIR